MPGSKSSLVTELASTEPRLQSTVATFQPRRRKPSGLCFLTTRLCFGYASCVGRDGRRGLGSPKHWRIAACRSMERRFCWLSEMGW
nr:MAG TPA: hypothetical protein [Caudoviricetes sp.]